MLSHQRQMLSFAIALMLSAILLCPLNSFAQDICFSESVASRMVVALEQAKIAEQQLTVASGINVELQQQLEILRTSVKLLENQIVVYKGYGRDEGPDVGGERRSVQGAVEGGTAELHG